MFKLKILLLVSVFFIISCNKEKKEILNIQNTIDDSQILEDIELDAVSYEIIDVENQSRKALGKKPLSQYEKDELEKLATNKKILYKIVLSKDVKENNIKPTIRKIIKDIISQNSDIDEIILWLYSDKELINEGYDLGLVIWAPFGKLGNITNDIALNNNRDNYSIDYDLKTNLDKYLSNRFEDVRKFGLTTLERKQVFKDKVKAEDNAFEYKQSEQERVLKKNYSKILKKYNLTLEQLQEISNEGQDKYWSLD